MVEIGLIEVPVPSIEEALSRSQSVSRIADLGPGFIEDYWKVVRRCLREAFDQSEQEADQAIRKARERMNSLSDEAVLLTYHDSPIQIAANLAGAEKRSLTEKELLAYDEILNAGRKDRPSRDQILRGRLQHPGFG